MADINNVDIVNIKDPNLFTAETDITAMEFVGKPSGNNRKMAGSQVLSEVITKTDLGSFTGSTIADNQNIKQAFQALETAVESVSGGGITYSRINAGVLQGVGVAGEVGYAGVAGSGIVSLTNLWSLLKGDLYVNIADDADGSKNFNLTINVANGTFNTWTGAGDHDLWIPQLQVWNVSPTALSVKTGFNVTMGNSLVIAPDVEWSANSITYKFLGSSDFGSLSRVLITIKP